MTTWKVPQLQPSLGEREAEAVAACVRSGWITEGPRCAEFGERVKAMTGVQYGVLAPNGTLALYLALKACGVGPGWDVVVPDLTFIASATAVIMAGARPTFVEVNEYGQMSRDDAFGSRHHGRWVYMPVHLYGAASNELPGIARRAATHNGIDETPIIEDACQGLGVTFNGKPCGSFGKAAAFSFFADKTITTGEGGFVGTNDSDVYERLRYLRNQGRLDRGSFIHPRVGQNFRMTDVQAAIGLVQLDRFEEIVEKKRAIYARYVTRLLGIVPILAPPPGSTHIPFRTVVFFAAGARLAEQYLREHGVEPRSSFYPLHKQPCLAHLTPREHVPGCLGCEGKLERPEPYKDEWFPNTMWFWEHALCLPVWPDMASAQVETVCDVVAAFAKKTATP